jgi:predicted GIY-YIG superfamily endonuclease
VYSIPCDCGKVYIGETGRSVQTRLKEHNADIIHGRTKKSTLQSTP